MGSIFGGRKTPEPDPELVKQRAEAAAKAQAEIDEAERKRKEEEDAVSRGLRGRKALLSSAGGELGFPAGLGA